MQSKILVNRIKQMVPFNPFLYGGYKTDQMDHMEHIADLIFFNYPLVSKICNVTNI